jgi:alpha-1,2-mannosyltransferase
MLRLRAAWGNDLPGGAPFIAAALAFGAVFVNLIHGQNGFLIAALFALTLSWLWEKPVLAGICFGLVLFTPQLGLLIPFALAASRYGRAFAAAAVTVMVLAAVTVLLFGWRRWLEFFAAAQFSRAAILDEGAVGYEKMVGIFAGMRLWRLPLSLAYAGQIFVSLAVVAAIVFLWRGHADVRRKGAALCLSTLLATPFAFGYDLMVLAPAILLLAALGKQRGLLPYGASLIALVWLMPAAEAGLAEIGLPLATLVAGAAFVFSLRAGLIPDSSVRAGG